MSFDERAQRMLDATRVQAKKAVEEFTKIPGGYWSSALHGYFRDHDTMSWGVVRGFGGRMMDRPNSNGDRVIVTGLDKSVAAAIACLLNGDVALALVYLSGLPDRLGE